MCYLRQNILILLFLVLPTFALADDWDKYMQYSERFYSFDKQDFRSITCNVDVPITKNQLKQLNAQLAPLKDKIELKEDLSEFSLTFSRNAGIKFRKPSLEIEIISEEGMSDPTKVMSGIELIRSGFNNQIQGTIMQLQGLFGELETPQRSRYTIEEISGDVTTSTVKYEKDGSNVTEVYSDKQRNIVQISKNGDKTSVVGRYKKITSNKLFLTDIEYAMDSAMGKIETKMIIAYENVDNIMFPSHIESRATTSFESMKQEGQLDIYLQNCVLQ